MQIPVYQIHNVLNVYRRQLSQSKNTIEYRISDAYSDIYRLDMSQSIKRNAIINQVALKIIGKMNIQKPDQAESHEKSGSPQKKNVGSVTKTIGSTEIIEYHIIDRNKKKITHSFSPHTLHERLKGQRGSFFED